jgi:hypothetical protein
MLYHYTYKIINNCNDKYYIGVRTCRGVLPKNDIGFLYFSSSSDKDFLLEQKDFPDRFDYIILEEFLTREEACKSEIELHKKLNVAFDKNSYNRYNASSPSFDRSGLFFTEEHRKKISQSAKERDWKPLSDDHKEKIKNSNTGKCFDIERKLNISESLKGRKSSQSHVEAMRDYMNNRITEEHRKNISSSCSGNLNGFRGKNHSDESREKMSKSAKSRPAVKESTREKLKINSSGKNNPMYGKKGKDSPCFGTKRKIVICEHCQKEVAINGYARYHGDKCKKK